MSQISVPVDYLIQKQNDKNLPVRDIQDMDKRPDAEPALFDQYGTHHSIRNP